MCKRWAESEQFQTFILFLILLTAVSMGFETVPEMADSYEDFFFFLNNVAQVIFFLEICIRLGAFAPHFKLFFKDPWNSFDFIIVVSSLLPGVGSFTLVARLLRVLRVLRVFSVSSKMREFVNRLKESFDEMAYAGLISILLGYIFAVSGHYLFSDSDPERWSSLGQASINIFYLLLLQDVQNLIAPLVQASFANIIFFLVFYFTFATLILSVITAALIQALRGKSD